MVKGVISQFDPNTQTEPGVVDTDTNTEDTSGIDRIATDIPLQTEKAMNPDDVPDLAPPDDSSSDDESEYLVPDNDPLIKYWMKQAPEFQEGELNSIRTEALALFLLGTDIFTPPLWVTALLNSHTLTPGREKSTSKMTDEEFQIVDILLQVTDKTQKMVKDEERLKDIVTMIIEMESNCICSEMMEISRLLATAQEYPFFVDVWREVEGLPNVSKYMNETLMLLIYFFKLVCQNIYAFGKEGRSLAIKLEPLGEDDQRAFDLNQQGGAAFDRQQYAKAISCYNKAIELDFANHKLFHKRGQAYFNQERYEEAYCDFRRVLYLDGTFQEGYYFCAEACLVLKRLEEAQKWNAKGLKCGSVTVEVSENLISQQDRIASEKIELELKHNRLKYEQLKEKALKYILEIKDMQEAYRNYRSALDMVDFGSLVRKMDKTEITVLRCACGITAIAQDSPETLQDAHQMFVIMHEEGLSNYFPLIFYGLSYTLAAQKRFQEALKYVEAGLKVCRKMQKKWKPVSWPNSDQVIEESQLETYQKLMENLLRKCRPLPATDTTPSSDCKEDSKLQKYQALTAEAVEALHHANHLRAFGKFQAAYDLMSLHQSVKETLSITDILTLRYACGITAVSQGSLKPLQEGLDIFEAMLKEGLGSTFPLTYYGLGKAFIALYRFGAALKYIDAGVGFPKRNRKNLRPVCWPSSKEMIEESIPEVYQQQMETMLKKCRYPPVPDAVCSVHISDREQEAPIYFYDPSFSGVIRLECYFHCKIAFHPSCWQDFKSQIMERTLDKDVLNHQCPTPDCGSVVRAVLISRPGHKNKEFVSAIKPPKVPVPHCKVLKMPKSNQEKIVRKAERKERRRRKRQEAKAMDGVKDFTESVDDNATLLEKNSERRAVANPAAMTVLRKEDENYVKYQGIQKQVKQKKKKEKMKQVLNVEVNFTDKDRSRLLGEHSLGDDLESESYAGTTRNHDVLSHRKPRTSSLTEGVAMGRNSYCSQTDEAITENLYEYFGEILKANGPLSLSDLLLRRELSCLPHEAVRVIQKAGGPPRFFCQSLKFVVIDEIVGNIADARQAHELARGLKPSVMLSNFQKGKPLLPNPDIQWPNPQGSTLMEAAARPVLVNGVLPSSYTSAQPFLQPSAHVTYTNSETASHVKKDSFNGIISDSGSIAHTVVTSSQPVPLKLLNQSRGNRLGATNSSISNGSSCEDNDDDGGDGESVGNSVYSKRSKGSSRVRTLSGSLNPSAPEFRPGQNKDTTVDKAINKYSNEPDVKRSHTFLLEYSAALGARPKTHNSYSHLTDSFLDKNPKTDYSSIDDLDDFTIPVTKNMKNICDDVDDSSKIPVKHRARSGRFRGPSQLTPESGGLGPSRPGSTSDLSETSDMSMGNLFRTSSPGSSVSSFKITSAHDYSSYMMPSSTDETRVLCKSVSPVAALLHERKLPQASVKSAGLSDWKTEGWGHSLQRDLSEKVQMGESASTPPLQTYTTSGFEVLEESKPAEAVSSDGGDKQAFSNNDFFDKHSTDTDFLFKSPGSSLYRPGPLVGTSSHAFYSDSGFDQNNGWLDSAGPAGSSLQTGAGIAPMTATSSIWSAFSTKPLHAFPSSSGTLHPYPSESYLSSGSTWCENSFPSAIRPDEDLVSLKPMSIESLFQPGKSKTQSSTSSFDLEMKDSDDEGKKWGMDEDKDWDVAPMKSFADKEVQAVVQMRAVEVNTDVDVVVPEPSSAYLLEENSQLVGQVQALLEDKNRLLVMLEHYREKNRLGISQVEALQREKNDVLMQSEIAIQNLSAEHSRKEQQIQDTVNHLESKSSQMETECKWFKQHLQAVEEEMQSEKSRAREAEIETVKMRQQVALMQFEFKRKEAEFHQHYVSKFALKCGERGEAVPEKIKEVIKYWENVLNALAFKEAQVRRDFEAVMSQVRAGKRLSELPLVSMTPPPLPKMPEGAPGVPANGQLPFIPYQMDQHQLRPSPTPSPPVRAQSPAMGDTVSVADAKAGAPAKAQNVNSALHPPGLRAPRPLVPPKGLASGPLPPAAPRLPISQPAAPVITQASFAAAAVRPILRPTLSLPKPPSPLTVVTTSQPHRPQQLNPSVSAVSRPVVGVSGNPGNNGVTIGHARILSSGQAGKQTSFDKLMNVLQKNFPSCTRDNFTQLVQELRRAHGGSLSGMSLEGILTRLTQMAIARGFKLCSNGETPQVQPAKQSTVGTESRSTTGPSPGMHPSWGTDWVQHLHRHPDCTSIGGGDNFEEEDPCAICHEELSSALITTLDCHHQFHDECIRRWFKEQTTCPNCRVHSLLQDDFPALK